ncbi:hypothetical protein E1A91_D01G242300v1 [Gossypium mustelinum]|uniref:Uncharacterized protein n=1 Tax=Gossypium mustelinum TaxID=34275 RepID=A0A5D2WAI6_GOSMU|nr:hypothetical protein E1A91_D01G242300v1 [Gossypium mustelinum]TYI98802.1 hypothetical protein E1A91_D01G242300v1 [Gossypium mustelinum]
MPFCCNSSLKNCSILSSALQAKLPPSNFDLDEEKQRCRRRTSFGTLKETCRTCVESDNRWHTRAVRTR